MSLTFAVIKETYTSESRVAASPGTIKKYVAEGHQIVVETQAGAGAAIPDSDFEAAGAKIVKTAAEAVKKADILLCVQMPDDKTLDALPAKSTVIGSLAPHKNGASLKKLADKKVNLVALEWLPRITRAQSMDILSSQANLAGYRAVLEATAVYSRALPMMMTAAGTVPPARVFVMGAGVAGLQAIATARRLGAVVSATDVRPAAKEQVESLGGNFVMVEDEETKAAETAGGYAKEMSADYKKKQAALIAETIKKQDIVITTALIPGKPAPVLVTEDMVKSMKPGSVIVDLATEQGGNCPLSKLDQVIEKHGVQIIGYRNLPARLAASSSLLYAKNLYNFVQLLVDKDSQKPNFNFEDEIISAVTLAENGTLRHAEKLGDVKTEKAKTTGTKKPAAQKATTKKAAAKPKKEAKPAKEKEPAKAKTTAANDTDKKEPSK